MAPDAALREFEAERDRLALLTRKGIGMPAAGMLYWLGVAILLRQFPQKTALVFSFALTGVVFPLGALLTRIAGGDLFAKSATLTPLGLMLAAVQLFYWPVVMAVLFSSHFLPYAWLYRSAAFGFLAVAATLVVSAGVIVTRSPLYATVPLLAAACYAVAVAMLWREVGALAPKEGGA